jgi:hypothetical protein
LDWLFNLEKINIQVGLYLKGFATILFIIIFFKHQSKGYHFKKILLYFLGLFLVYSLISDNILSNLYLTVRIAYWIFGSLAFYYFFSNNIFSKKKLRSMLLWVVLIASLFTIQLMIQSEEHQNASAYLLLWCMPLLMFLKKSRLIQLGIMISIVAIMITVKRGAMLALLASLVAYFIGMSHISGKFRNKFKVFISSLFLLGVALLVVYYNWEFVSVRLEDKGGSGRDIMYSAIIDNYLNSGLSEVAFGRGINAVQKFTAIFISGDPNSIGVAAHSDWLQYIYDFGFFGIILMVLFHVEFLKLIHFHAKFKTLWFPILLMTYIIFSLTTVYSFILNAPDAIFLGIIIALISAETKKCKMEIEESNRVFNLPSTQ